jgi:hypothetical protein
MKIQPRLSLLALAILVVVLLGALFVMSRHHNQGANLRTPSGSSQGPG